MAKSKDPNIQYLVFSDEDVGYINHILSIKPPIDKDEAYAGPEDVFIAYRVSQIVLATGKMQYQSVTEITETGVNFGREGEFEMAMVVYHSYLYVSAAYSFETDKEYSSKERNMALDVAAYLIGYNSDLGHALANVHSFHFWNDSKKYGWKGRKIQRHINPMIMLSTEKPNKSYYEYNLNWIGVDGFNYLRSRMIGSDISEGAGYALKCRHTDFAGNSLDGEYSADGHSICPLCRDEIPTDKDTIDLFELRRSIGYIGRCWNIIRTKGDPELGMVNRIARTLANLNYLPSMIPSSALKRTDEHDTCTAPKQPHMSTPGSVCTEHDLSEKKLIKIIDFLRYAMDNRLHVVDVFRYFHTSFTERTKELLIKIADDVRDYDAGEVLRTIQGYSKP